MHEVMTRLMTSAARRPSRFGAFNPFIEARRLIGLRFHDRELTQAHLDDHDRARADASGELEADG